MLNRSSITYEQRNAICQKRHQWRQGARASDQKARRRRRKTEKTPRWAAAADKVREKRMGLSKPFIFENLPFQRAWENPRSNETRRGRSKASQQHGKEVEAVVVVALLKQTPNPPCWCYSLNLHAQCNAAFSGIPFEWERGRIICVNSFMIRIFFVISAGIRPECQS